MSVAVIKQGVMDTIQDEGRFGYQHLGINPGGSMDLVAAMVANMLVGNERDKPVVELHFPASIVQFQRQHVFALSGADFTATLNGQSIPINATLFAPEEAVLKFNYNNRGSRCYLAVCGGWDVESWLNSYSTNLYAGAGGYHGRALKKDDVIQVKSSGLEIRDIEGTSKLPVEAQPLALYNHTGNIRCIAGSEFESLTRDAATMFQSSCYRISAQSNRMGYRMEGNILLQTSSKQLLSSGVTRGTVQLLPSGQLIILMADHQTTGGYPKIAHVIGADLPTLAQMRANEEIQFKLVTHIEAEAAFFEQQQYLQQMKMQIDLQLRKLLK
jgi:antagonist of KipI